MAKIRWEEGLLLETEISILIRKQEEYGVKFDIGRAVYYVSYLEKEKDRLYSLIRPYLKYIVSCEETKDSEGNFNYVRKIRLKNGKFTNSVINWYQDDPDVVEGEFTRISIEEPSLSKRQCITKALIELGWQPKVFTDKGSPKITHEGLPVDTLEKVGDFGKKLALWYVYNHRQSQIQGLINNVRDDGRIAAQMNTCATNTFRAAHRVVANIPRPSSIFGKEMRSLFIADEDCVIVGADASGLELRMLAHYMKDQDYIDLILNGDVHTFNQHAAGLETRDLAKTMIYGWLYGAGNEKLGNIIGKGAKAGGELKNKLMKNIPSLGRLMNQVREFVERNGYIPSIDGRKIHIRKFEGRYLVHTALNALLQASGSIVVKRALILADKAITIEGLDARQILYVHDEAQFVCNRDIAEHVGEILIDSFRASGKYYNLRIPIDGEYKIGINWGETH